MLKRFTDAARIAWSDHKYFCHLITDFWLGPLRLSIQSVKYLNGEEIESNPVFIIVACCGAASFILTIPWTIIGLPVALSFYMMSFIAIPFNTLITSIFPC